MPAPAKNHLGRRWIDAGILGGAALSLALIGGDASGAEADALALPPWSAHRLPLWAESVHVIEADQPVLSAPHGEASRRGSIARDVHLPLFGARPGPGCGSLWLHVGPRAWACGDEVRLSASAPIAAGYSVLSQHEDLPFSYFFAGPDGSLGYRELAEADVGVPEMRLEPGFAVAIVAQRSLAGQTYGRTARGLWVPMRDFGPASPLAFRGAEIGELRDGVIEVAWVVADRAALHRQQGASFVPTGRSLPRFTEVAWIERRERFGGSYVRVDEAHWVRARDLRHPTIAAPPDEADIRHGARWIDIELESQTLVAYEGDRPVFATIVSTGKGKTKGHPFETPKGVHRIWVKLLSATMDNLEDEAAGHYWRIEDVPYVQFFHKGVGLHAAFWHRSFGQVRSHGCVNLSPADAKRLFSFTQPQLPSGWTAVLPSAGETSTIVRVR